MPLQDGDLFLIDNNKKIAGENLFNGSYDEKWMMIQSGSSTFKVKVGDLCEKAGANRYCLVNRGANSYKALVSDVCDTFNSGGGGPGGRPQIPWDKVFWMVYADSERGLFGAQTHIANRGLCGTGDNVYNNVLPSGDQYGFHMGNTGSQAFTFQADQGFIAFSANEILTSSSGQTKVCRSSQKVVMSKIIDMDGKTSATINGGYYGTKYRFTANWIFHGAQVTMTKAKSNSTHSGHQVIESGTESATHNFTIPCSNSGSTSTAFLIIAFGSKLRVEYSYSPAPKYGGSPYLKSHSGRQAVEICETDLGFNGNIEVNADNGSDGPIYVVACYWTMSY